MESVAPTQWCVFILAMETSRSAPKARVRQIELLDPRELLRRLHARDVVQVQIDEAVFEVRDWS